MDISAQNWESEFSYSKDDIVKIDDLTKINYGNIQDDDSIWTGYLNSTREGWGAYEPNTFKYTDLTKKTEDSEDYTFFYHSNESYIYTSVLEISNEAEWLKQEISNNNLDNLLLRYINSNGEVLIDSSGELMSYSGSDLDHQYFEPDATAYADPKRMGIAAGNAYVSMQFDKFYSHVQVMIVKIDSGETIISERFVVYSEDDPVFGWGGTGEGITDEDQDTEAEVSILGSMEKGYGGYFPVNPSWNYSAQAMVKLTSKDTELIDDYKTFITGNGTLTDLKNSIGVGVGIKFYDQNSFEIVPGDRRNTYRALAKSELSHLEYYSIYLDIKSKDIPVNARTGRVFLFVYGHKDGGFRFKRIKAVTTNQFFYCIKDHKSSIYNYPGSELWTDDNYWTQNFEWRPSYGSKTNFVAINESLDLGEGSDYVNNLAINSLPLEIDVSFNNRTDKEAKAIMHFLQEKHFAYQSIFGIDYKGDRLLSGDVSSFRFTYTHPYKKDLYFTCTDFTHSILYRNNNVVTAKFVCNTESTLKSVESHAGYNNRLDALFTIFVDKETKFVKGEQIKLNTFSLESIGDDDEAKELDGILNIVKTSEGNAQITFSEDQLIKVGDCIFIDIPEEEGSIFNVGLSKILHIIDNKNYIFGPILESGSDVLPQSINIKLLKRCPSDCLVSRPLLPDGVESIPPVTVDPATGELRKRVVILKNYRRIQIDSTITKESNSILVTPLSTFTLTAKDDFQVLIAAAAGRHSIYLEDPDRVPAFPWLRLRSFEQRPSLSFELSNSPDNVQTDFIKYYNKKYKKQINQNLSKFTVVFDQRDDEEALEILQFLESHLGYKKFRFSMPRPYLVDGSYDTTPSRSNMSVFFCPSWDHEIVYKNNHKITATFIESVTSINEDLFKVFGIGQKEEKPCYSAHLEDPIITHEVCPPSSSLQAATCGGFQRLKGGELGISLKRKVVDIVFIIDTTEGMVDNNITGLGFNLSKFNAAIDTIRKMVVAYDNYQMPGTEDYGGQIKIPSVNFVDISGDQNSPPWPIDKNGNSLIDAAVQDINEDLRLKGFNTKNFEKFKIKIEKAKVNIGLMLMGSGPENRTIIDLSTPDSFDKVNIYQKTEEIPTEGLYEGEYFAKYIAKAMAQMYNSPRAEHISDRIIVMLSDGFISGGTEFDINAEGEEPNTYSPRAIQICEAIKQNGELAKRRPADEVLSRYGHDTSQAGTILKFLNEYKYIESNNGKSLYYNPDNGVENPSWYEEPIDTVFIAAAIGVEGQVSNKLRNYVYDHDKKPENEEFYFEITNSNDREKEIKRLVDLIKAVEILSEESGYENHFSITVHNCGPNEVDIINTLINIESDPDYLTWTTERLTGGIPKEGNYKNLQYIESSQVKGQSVNGNGGQYYGDPNNQKILTDEKTEESNILWESFNTKYEVYRDCTLSLIDGGWKNKPSSGVDNIGVASKGMPVRVFSGNKDIEIIDYNIGNANQTNAFIGNYSHLPKLKAGESLDLFFGIRVNNLVNINENIQLVFNTDDGTAKKSDCFAEIHFPVRIEDISEQAKEPQELSIKSSVSSEGLCMPTPFSEAWVNETATPFLSIPKSLISLGIHPNYELHFYGENQGGGGWYISWVPKSPAIARWQLLNIPYLPGTEVDFSNPENFKRTTSNSIFEQPGFYDWAYRDNQGLYPHSELWRFQLEYDRLTWWNPSWWIYTYSFGFAWQGAISLTLHPYAMHWAKEKTGLDKADKFTQAIKFVPNSNKAIFYYTASSSESPNVAIYGYIFDGVYEIENDGTATVEFQFERKPLKDKVIKIKFSQPDGGWNSGDSTIGQSQDKVIIFRRSTFGVSSYKTCGAWGQDGGLKTNEDVINNYVNYPNSFFPW